MGGSASGTGIVHRFHGQNDRRALGRINLIRSYVWLCGIITFAALLAVACTTVAGIQAGNPPTTASDWQWQLPLGFAPPPVPDSNPMSIDKVELGRRLFYDKRLSRNGTGSCASCHQQRLAFTDGRAHAVGVTGELHSRSSMTLVNVAYNSNYTWASRQVRSLEQQIPIPLFSEQPVELGLRGRESTLVETFTSDPVYAGLFESAYPEDAYPVSIDNIVKALASFVRTIISAESAFDRRLFRDDQNALSASATRGMQLFFSEKLHCGTCHSGRNLSGGQHLEKGPDTTAEFHNTGLYNVAGNDRYPRIDSGLRMESGDPNDDGKFRAPTLRGIALTAPYMHDGSIATLSEVLDHYAAGGRSIHAGEFSGDGSTNSNKDELLSGFQLNDMDRKNLLDFFDSLSDYAVLDDLRFSQPEEPGARPSN